MRALIVEDEERIADFLQKGLGRAGFTTSVAGTGAAALAAVAAEGFDLVILDLGLPDADGVDVLRELRRSDRRTPVVILSARDGDRHIAAGVEAGADDYVTKPFRFADLLARLRSLPRGEEGEDVVLRAGDAVLDVGARHIRLGERVVNLGARELALARALFRDPGRTLTHGQLAAEVWGPGVDPGPQLEAQLDALERKLGATSIVVVPGEGVRLDARPEP